MYRCKPAIPKTTHKDYKESFVKREPNSNYLPYLSIILLMVAAPFVNADEEQPAEPGVAEALSLIHI